MLIHNHPDTLWLIRLGVHPDQLALPYSYKVKHSDAWYYREQEFERKNENLSAPRRLRRVGNLPPRDTLTGEFIQPVIDPRVTYLLDYHAFLYDRYDLFPCRNSTCQLHMRCGMGVMPSPKNKAWQILSSDGFKN